MSLALSHFISRVLLESSHLNKAAGVLIIRAGKALCVSRGQGSDQWGFPCGKVEPGETFSQAAVRELEEETGLTLTDPKEIYRGESTHGFEVAMFIGDITGRAVSSDEGDLAWKDLEEMTDPDVSPFWEYTSEMFDEAAI